MSRQSKKPQIHMIDAEADALADLAMGNRERHPLTTELLLDEILRAKTYPPHKVPQDVVTMGSTVEFVDDARGVSRTVQLVYPREADTAANRISILTPLGAGLIGMRTGASIMWPDRSGAERSLTIVKVAQASPCEAAGDRQAAGV
ncbi:nucleoside diphosphate kinase regulator [Novosphingobium sp. M1R2S20]|uniref:Nucleoside diphosphate kinase regulator n=1 Tax=Novosphingobium rhizovicinum TaxID=3228928 RepID=A0ABV3RE94_9SPHN